MSTSYEYGLQGAPKTDTIPESQIIEATKVATAPITINKSYTPPAATGALAPKVFHVHYKKGCPYTERLIVAFLKVPEKSITLHMFPSDFARTREQLERYLSRLSNGRPMLITYPRVFYEGHLVGGSDDAARVFSQI